MSSIFNKNYIGITYKDVKTEYPTKFCEYIIKTCQIPKGSKILDIGCGDGTFAKAFEYLGMEAYGLDISEESKHLLNGKLKICDLSKTPYPFETESFDYIFSKSVVEHLRDPDILIDEAYRLLKPNGLFICIIWDI